MYSVHLDIQCRPGRVCTCIQSRPGHRPVWTYIVDLDVHHCFTCIGACNVGIEVYDVGLHRLRPCVQLRPEHVSNVDLSARIIYSKLGCVRGGRTPPDRGRFGSTGGGGAPYLGQ